MDVMSKIKELGALYKEGKYSECLNEIQAYWESLSKPQEQIPNSYLLIEYGTRISLLMGDYNVAMKWAKMSLMYNEIRNTKGEGEFLIGKVAFEMGDIATARENFLIAQKKSGGKAFQGEDPKYKNIIK